MDILKALEAIRNPILDTLFTWIAVAVNEYLFIVVAVVLFWCVSKQKGYYVMTLCFFALISNSALKIIFRIPRPWMRDPSLTTVESARDTATGYSFPSGHTQNINALMGGLSRSFDNRPLRVCSVVIVLLTAFSRLYLGVHSLWDVLAGMALSLVMVFAFYPAFRRAEDYPRSISWILAAGIALAAAFVAYVSFASFPAEVDEANLAEAVKSAWMCLGIGAGLLVSYLTDKYYTQFNTDSVWWIQIIKCALGIGLMLAVKAVLKAPLNTLFAGHPAADAVRYFAVMIVAGTLWPMTFRWWNSLALRTNR